YLIDKPLARARIRARNDARRGRYDGADLRHAEAGAQFRDRSLNRIGHAVGYIGGSHRTARGMERNSADAILPQIDPDPTEAAGILRDVRIDAVEYAYHGGGTGTRLAEIEAARQTVGIIGKVNRDEAPVAVHGDPGFDPDALRRRTRERIV